MSSFLWTQLAIPASTLPGNPAVARYTTRLPHITMVRVEFPSLATSGSTIGIRAVQAGKVIFPEPGGESWVFSGRVVGTDILSTSIIMITDVWLENGPPYDFSLEGYTSDTTAHTVQVALSVDNTPLATTVLQKMFDLMVSEIREARRQQVIQAAQSPPNKR